jgi:hypothetical protein
VGVGLLAWGGSRYSSGLHFFDEALAEGPVPAGVVAIFGAFTATSFRALLAANDRDVLDFM